MRGNEGEDLSWRDFVGIASPSSLNGSGAWSIIASSMLLVRDRQLISKIKFVETKTRLLRTVATLQSCLCSKWNEVGLKPPLGQSMKAYQRIKQIVARKCPPLENHRPLYPVE